jgi:hypothetical protein
MSIKVIIANNNDILYNSLSNLVLQNELQIEITNVPTDKLNELTCHIKPKDNLIILDAITSVSFCGNILKNAINRMDKGNIIILVIDSKHITDIINQGKQHCPFWLRKTYLSLLDAINIIVDSLKDTLEIEKTIDDILWKLGFTPHFKGTAYIKDTILLAYTDTNLLEDMNVLVEKVAEKNNVENEKIVRSLMDKTLNNIFDSIDKNVIYDIFKDNYDGRKISLKYFVDLCIRYLDEKRYCCLED